MLNQKFSSAKASNNEKAANKDILSDFSVRKITLKVKINKIKRPPLGPLALKINARDTPLLHNNNNNI